MIEVKNSNLDQSMLTEKEVKVSNKITRKSFAKTRFDYPLPNLVEIQTASYEWFLKEGFREVLKESSPITDSTGNLVLDYLDFSFNKKEPKCSMEQSKDRDVNFAAPMRIKARLTNKETGEVKESETFLCDFPIMTDTGTFVINGAERVVVSQIVRSPGMYYDYDTDKLGKKIYSAQIIPYRGAWLEYEVDANGLMFVRIDKNRKVPFTMLLHALGLETRDDIYAMFGDEERLGLTFDKDETEGLAEMGNDTNVVAALKEIYRRVRPGEPATEEAARTQLHNFFFDARRYDLQPVGRYKFDRKAALHIRITGRTAAENVVSPMTGEVVCEKDTYITRELAGQIEHACVNEMYVWGDDGKKVKVIGNNTVNPLYFFGFKLNCVKEKARIPVMKEIAEKCQGDEEAIQKMAEERFYDLCPRCLTYDDVFASVSYQIGLMHGVGVKDDIDHLGNRRIRAVGEQLQNQIRIGFSRMDKIIRERMETQEEDKLTIQHLINIRPITSAIREFFGSSQLSQFMDQNNPLAELTHKRRISALGQGGLSRDRASFDVRDIHYTQYGRICPVETPEGPNIGLITYMASYAKVNPYGFMMAPYRKVIHEKMQDGTVRHYVSNEVEYMTADEEDKCICAQANEPLNENNEFINRKVIARDKTEVVEVTLDKVDYMDVAPRMLVSVAANMIPFLENDDNTRALMGSNMQKQAVPLMVTDSPIVGTGMEYKAAYDSGVVVKADRDGIVDRVQANEIVVATENGERDVYELLKFRRTNQGTCFDQRPIVRKGDVIHAGDVIADGPATYNGEISLGKNALVGFMTWEGYNYEDAVLLNEKLVRDDTYTSLHIEEHTIDATVTKIGPEEFTNEIPNVPANLLTNLNPDGIIRVGTEVHSGDILVGKITPKGETELTPEEKLLRAIFGKNSNEVRDTSLRLAHGESGIVVDVKVFSAENGDELDPNVKKSVKVYVAQKRKISVGDKMAGRHGNKGVVSRILPPEDMPFLPDGTPLDIVLNPLGVPSRMNIGQVLEVHLGIAARKLGWKIMTPVFDGANEKDIMRWMKAAALERDMFPLENPEGKDLYEVLSDANGKKTLRKLSSEERANTEYWKQLQAEKRLKILDGKIALRDGRTGDTFDNPVTVGIMYYLKLHHLVEDKIHARSTGPYSLITQQPLGGKAQFGGQRFGEMEVWALEAYGAAYTLQEILTVKSDDINGRRRAYEAIIKGENIPTPGVPESFKVMVRELQSLALDVRVLDKDGNDIDLAKLCTENDRPAFKFGKKDKDFVNETLSNYSDDVDASAYRVGTSTELRLDEMRADISTKSSVDNDVEFEEEEVYEADGGSDDAYDDEN